MVKLNDISLKITGLICCGERSQEYEFERCASLLSYWTEREQYLTVVFQTIRMRSPCFKWSNWTISHWKSYDLTLVGKEVRRMNLKDVWASFHIEQSGNSRDGGLESQDLTRIGLESQIWGLETYLTNTDERLDFDLAFVTWDLT